MPSPRPNDAISYTVHTITRSESGVSYRWPRVWSQEDRVLQDPRQRGVLCTSAAFRRSLFRRCTGSGRWGRSTLDNWGQIFNHKYRRRMGSVRWRRHHFWCVSRNRRARKIDVLLHGLFNEKITGFTEATYPISGASGTRSIAGTGGTPGSGETSPITGAGAEKLTTSAGVTCSITGTCAARWRFHREGPSRAGVGATILWGIGVFLFSTSIGSGRRSWGTSLTLSTNCSAEICSWRTCL